MRVIGIDLSAQPLKTFACILDDAGADLVASVTAGCDDGELRRLAAGCRRVAIDAPFGWPDEFVDAVVAHRAMQPWPAPSGGDPAAYRAALSFRATDRVVSQTRRPLSVSTDKLGVTAMRCAALLDRWSSEGAVDRSGGGRFVEVYPAGALVRWGLSAAGYKGSDRTPLTDLLARVREALPQLAFSDGSASLCASNDDAFDALVAALVARAAGLGLTGGPPEAHRETARREGWIHLPAWGSLRLLARSPRDLVGSDPAIALAGRLAGTGVALDAKGYAERFEDVLVGTVSPPARDAIRAELTGKGGSELTPRGGNRPKFHAAHSSAALAANCFGPFLREQRALPFAGRRHVGETHLEVECPTGLGGTPPTLDCVVEGDEVLGIESKCVEPFSRHVAKFSSAYDAALGRMGGGWRDEYHRLKADPHRYRYLDAAQLVKHHLGLRSTYPRRRPTLAYLYWTPANADEIAPCVIHAAEVVEFARRVRRDFVAMPYAQLWSHWASADQPEWLRGHARALRERYEVAL